MLARLIPEKGVLEFIDEAAACNGLWASITVAGAAQDAAYARAVSERIAAHGLGETIALIGHEPDVGALMDRVDALVVPSTGNEGQPGVIIEGLAHGRPVVVRRTVWSEDFAGLPVFPFDDARSLAAALEKVATATVDQAALRHRFGPEQFIATLDAAAACT